MKKTALAIALSLLFLASLHSEEASTGKPADKPAEKPKVQKKIAIRVPHVFEAKALAGYSQAATSSFVTALEKTELFDILEYPEKTDEVVALKVGEKLKPPENVKRPGRARFIFQGKMTRKKGSSNITLFITIIDFDRGKTAAEVSVKAFANYEIVDKAKLLAEEVKNKMLDIVSGKLDEEAKAKWEKEKKKNEKIRKEAEESEE